MPPILYVYSEPIGDVTVMVPIDCPVIVCVRLASGLITVVKQGSGTAGAGSVFLQLAKKPENRTAVIKNVRFFIINKCTKK